MRRPPAASETPRAPGRPNPPPNQPLWRRRAGGGNAGGGKGEGLERGTNVGTITGGGYRRLGGGPEGRTEIVPLQRERREGALHRGTRGPAQPVRGGGTRSARAPPPHNQAPGWCHQSGRVSSRAPKRATHGRIQDPQHQEPRSQRPDFPVGSSSQHQEWGGAKPPRPGHGDHAAAPPERTRPVPGRQKVPNSGLPAALGADRLSAGWRPASGHTGENLPRPSSRRVKNEEISSLDASEGGERGLKKLEDEARNCGARRKRVLRSRFRERA